MICEPCRPQHDPADCIDSVAGREYPHRHCACQHRDRSKIWVTSPLPSFNAHAVQEAAGGILEVIRPGFRPGTGFFVQLRPRWSFEKFEDEFPVVYVRCRVDGSLAVDVETECGFLPPDANYGRQANVEDDPHRIAYSLGVDEQTARAVVQTAFDQLQAAAASST